MQIIFSILQKNDPKVYKELGNPGIFPIQNLRKIKEGHLSLVDFYKKMLKTLHTVMLKPIKVPVILIYAARLLLITGLVLFIFLISNFVIMIREAWGV